MDDLNVESSRALAVVQGLNQVLDDLEDDLCGDSRYYALVACMAEIERMLRGIAGKVEAMAYGK